MSSIQLPAISSQLKISTCYIAWATASAICIVSSRDLAVMLLFP
jgi:hypothetical protein